MSVWLSFQIKETSFAALKKTFCVRRDRFLHLMTTLHSISDSTRFIVLFRCW